MPIDYTKFWNSPVKEKGEELMKQKKLPLVRIGIRLGLGVSIGAYSGYVIAGVASKLLIDIINKRKGDGENE